MHKVQSTFRYRGYRNQPYDNSLKEIDNIWINEEMTRRKCGGCFWAFEELSGRRRSRFFFSRRGKSGPQVKSVFQPMEGSTVSQLDCLAVDQIDLRGQLFTRSLPLCRDAVKSLPAVVSCSQLISKSPLNSSASKPLET